MPRSGYGTGIHANLMRPTKATGTLGEARGKPTLVCKGVPFRTFKTLSGNEQESARQNGADAQYEIEIWGSSKWLPLEDCWFELLPLTDPPRKLNIEFVDDRKHNGKDLRLLCGENK